MEDLSLEDASNIPYYPYGGAIGPVPAEQYCKNNPYAICTNCGVCRVFNTPINVPSIPMDTQISPLTAKDIKIKITIDEKEYTVSLEDFLNALPVTMKKKIKDNLAAKIAVENL